ncbi:MAG: tRNA (adenosine(37)-N6)-threonylcarbamoyltransferase complex dimerization subunit type 1 TsaB, partial [Mariprofundales bacterium]|nr:tRNA (adenosine(37)-N6)-threonylcarbamoyltransferase complex dimerization subunit type 1 TsaB [Mariprofundales bacterium]
PQWESLLAQAAISWQQLDGFAIGAGPGSFTAIRVVAATINGINSILQRPIYRVDSLAILALQSEIDGAVWVVDDARVGEAFVGCYQQGRAIHTPILIRWEMLQSHLDNLPVVCSQPRPDHLHNRWITPDESRRTAALAQLTQRIHLTNDLPREIYPDYLQPTQAERNLQPKPN